MSFRQFRAHVFYAFPHIFDTSRQQLVHRWKRLAENDAAIAPIQLLIECVDRSCGGHGLFRLENVPALDLQRFDWRSYFEDRIHGQRRPIHFDYDMQRGYAEPIGVTIAQLTRATDDPAWLTHLSECFREMARQPGVAQLVAQLPAFWMLELSGLLADPIGDDVRDHVERVLDHAMATVNDHMTSFEAQAQFVTTFHGRLACNLANVDVGRLASVFVKLISFRNEQLDALALSHIFKLLATRGDGHTELLDVCSTREFTGALNDILDKRSRIALVRHAFRIAIMLQR